MKNKISKNIDRLSLHDSHIETIEKSQNKLILTLDWAKLGNYSEVDIDQGIILSKCCLIFEELNDEKLRLDFSGFPDYKHLKPKEIEFNQELFQNWLILENKLVGQNIFCISGFFDYEKISGWLDWQFIYKHFELFWENHITWEEWKNGKSIEE